MVADCVRKALTPLASQIDAIDAEIEAIDDEIAALVQADERARRLMTVPGVGPLTASAIVATVQDNGAFANGREFAAFLGLTPRQSSSRGKEKLGRITKMGEACATLCHRKRHNDALRLWADRLLARKGVKYGLKLTAVALANKAARIVFALLTRGGIYESRPAST